MWEGEGTLFWGKGRADLGRGRRGGIYWALCHVVSLYMLTSAFEERLPQLTCNLTKAKMSCAMLFHTYLSEGCDLCYCWSGVCPCAVCVVCVVWCVCMCGVCVVCGVRCVYMCGVCSVCMCDVWCVVCVHVWCV